MGSPLLSLSRAGPLKAEPPALTIFIFTFYLRFHHDFNEVQGVTTLPSSFSLH